MHCTRISTDCPIVLYEDGEKGIRRATDPGLRVQDMDRDGVDAEVIYFHGQIR